MSPPASQTLITRARIISPDTAGPGYRRARAFDRLSVLDPGEALIDASGGTIIATGPQGSIDAPHADRFDANGRVLMPAFIDAHTHALWVGDRLDEWDLKRSGTPYLDILRAGGGIMSTVRAVRAATPDQLTRSLRHRLRCMLREGTMAVEIKSGYGLNTDTELKMLRAIRVAADGWPGTIVPTACIGHAIDTEDPANAAARAAFIERTIRETLPAVSAEFPAITIDAYCEQGAWTVDECVRLFEASSALGHPIRVHTDQFNELGMTHWALEHHARSVDHLEATSPSMLQRIGRTPETAAVLLPCSGFHVDGRYADGRALANAGAAIVIATNCNPGSAPSSSMPMAIALSVRHNGLSPRQAIIASTANAAALLGLHDHGRIEPGARADLILLRHRDERQLAYEFGGNPIDAAWCAGRSVHASSQSV